MAFTIVKTSTIANGASQSNVVDLEGGALVGINMPAAWTAANLTFLSSEYKDGTFDPVYDTAGTEVTVTAAASRNINISPDGFRGMRYMKIRSGTSGTPVNQGAERIIVVLISERG